VFQFGSQPVPWMSGCAPSPAAGNAYSSTKRRKRPTVTSNRSSRKLETIAVCSGRSLPPGSQLVSPGLQPIGNEPPGTRSAAQQSCPAHSVPSIPAHEGPGIESAPPLPPEPLPAEPPDPPLAARVFSGVGMLGSPSQRLPLSTRRAQRKPKSPSRVSSAARARAAPWYTSSTLMNQLPPRTMPSDPFLFAQSTHASAE